MNNAERIARMSPEKRAEFETALAKAQWMSKLSRCQIKAYMWYDGQRKLGCTYDDFDERVATWALREETFRMFDEHRDHRIRAMDVKSHFEDQHRGINHHAMIAFVQDSLCRLVARGVMFPAGGRSFTHNSSTPADDEWIATVKEHIQGLEAIEQDARENARELLQWEAA